MTSPAGGPWRVAVAGGGMTGLAAAYYLQELARQRRVPVEITVVEAATRLGGKVATERTDEFRVEAGPDSFLARKPWARELAESLGLADELVTPDPHRRRTYIIRRGVLHPVPEGLSIFFPARLGPVFRSKLLSPAGKARLLLEPLVPAAGGDDETIAGFVRRRAGGEVLDYLAEPLLTGIYAGRADRLSLLAVAPQLKEMERRHGSLFRAFRAQPRRPAGGPMFLTLRTGLETLVERTAAALRGAQVRTGVKVEQVGRVGPEESASSPEIAGAGARRRPRYVLALSDGSRLAADAVILATPAFVTARILASAAPDAVKYLESIPYVSVMTCALAFRREELVHPLDGTGFLVPRVEDRAITACTWVSSKWPHLVSPGWVLFRCFLGRDGQEEAMSLDDEQVVAAVRRELKELMGIDAPPRMARVFRFPHAMPQYTAGHLARVEALEETLAKHPGLFVAGAGYRGLGLPDCVRQGQQAAHRALAFLAGPDPDRDGESRA